MHPVHCRLLITAALLAGCALRPACAQIKIGVTLSTTGPAVSLGIPEKNTIALLPKTIGGKTVDYICSTTPATPVPRSSTPAA